MLPFRHPFTSTVSGPTTSGKTNFVLRLIDNVDDMIQPTPEKIIYYYTKYQSIFDDYTQVDFCQGIPKVNDVEKASNALVVLDDLMVEADQKIC